MYSIALFESKTSDPVIKHVDSFGELLNEKDKFFYNRILSTAERTYSATAPWMNRIDFGTEYIVIPKKFEHEGDMRIAVSDKFTVIKMGDNDLATIQETDIEKIKTAIEAACTPEAVARNKRETAEAEYYNMLFQTYRAIYASADDKYTQKLRSALIENSPDCEYWVKVIRNALITATTHPKDKEEMYFFMFIIEAHYKAVIFSEEIPDGNKDIYVPFFSLEAALRDPVKKTMLIRALEPESLRIYREATACS